MSFPEGTGDPGPTGGGSFATTHWSVVLAARDGDSTSAGEALEELCRAYWYPLYVFIRRNGHCAEEAQDLTQAFFARLLEKDYLSHLVHREGRFRAFLLKFLQHFLSNERHKHRAQKRGFGQPLFSLDEVDPEQRYQFEPQSDDSPEREFERQWARTLIQRSLDRLRHEYCTSGRGTLFERLKEFHPGEHGAVSYAELGLQLGLSEGAVKVAVHRLRQRHRELLREEIAQTVTTAEELEAEARHLITLFSNSL